MNTYSKSLTVQNGTKENQVVISEKVSEFVSQWRVATKKTVRAVIDQANIIKKSKDELDKNDFTHFLSEIGVSTSSAKKLIVIANKAECLLKKEDHLPLNWTTIYSLASEDDAVIEQLFDNNLISNDMTAARLSANVASLSVSSELTEPKQSVAVVKILLHKMNYSGVTSTLEYLNDLKSKNADAIVFDDESKKILEQVTSVTITAKAA